METTVVDHIKELIIKALKDLGIDIKPEEIFLEHPVEEKHGDYASNVAMKIHKKLGVRRSQELGIKNPFGLAEQIVKKISLASSSQLLTSISAAPPGFINFTLSHQFLSDKLNLIIKDNLRYGATQSLVGKKILLEHTSPNPQTTIMLGHLRNNFLGMAVANLLTYLGAEVTRDCVVNDRGIHLCRATLGYLFFGQKKSIPGKEKLLNFKDITDKEIEEISKNSRWQDLLKTWVKDKTNWFLPEELNLKPDHTNLIWYVLGSRAYSQIETAKAQVGEISIAWEKEDQEVWQIWKQILFWSDKGYQATYQRVGSVHDFTWRESEHYKAGKKIVEEGLKKGVFRKSQGAIVTSLEKYGLSDTVVVKTDGTALYITQDLALTKLKTQKFPSDLYIWAIGQEQTHYFKQLFAVCEQLGFGKRENFYHLSYALINFKGGGKMATRKGNVVMADEILDNLKAKALKIIQSSNQELRGKVSEPELNKLAETVAIGAIKYSLLKFGRETTVFFDIDESLSLQGDSGPYIQYTYARTQSVIEKSKIKDQISKIKIKEQKFNNEELAILRMLYKFPETVFSAAKNYQPNLICEFLYDLCQKYNLFYNKHRILNAQTPELVNQRLAVTEAVGIVLKNGLNLLGIKALEKM